jgi:hypothetical protein
LSVPEALNSVQHLALLSELFAGIREKVGISPRYFKEKAKGRAK